MPIDAYANRTGTRENLAGLRKADWGLLLCASKSPKRDHRTEGFAKYMLDNAAYKCREKGATPEDRLDYWSDNYLAPFELLIETHGEGAALVVAPDIYCGGELSLDTSLRWVEWLLAEVPGKVLIPTQDGMTQAQLEPHIGGRVGLAVGGSTTWKWASLTRWAHLAQRTGAHLHILRANSGRMAHRLNEVGADSFDGSGPSKFVDHLRRVEAGRQRPAQCELVGLELPNPFEPKDMKLR